MTVVIRTATACLYLFAGALSAAETGFYFGVLGGQSDHEFDPPQVPVLVAEPVPNIGTPALDDVGGILLPRDDFFGYADFNVYPAAIISPLSWPPGADSEAAAWGAFVGYRIVRYAAIELAYLNLGELERAEVDQIGPVSAPITISSEYELETRGPTLSALGIWPVSEHWDIYVRAGVLFADMEISSAFSSSSAQFIGSSFATTFGSEALLWGAGAQFNWGDHWAMRLDFQRFENVGDWREAGEADIDLLSLGLIFRL